jgi:hypothetical protein
VRLLRTFLWGRGSGTRDATRQKSYEPNTGMLDNDQSDVHWYAKSSSRSMHLGPHQLWSAVHLKLLPNGLAELAHHTQVGTLVMYPPPSFEISAY